MDTKPKLIRPGEAAKRYGVSILTLYSWVSKGYLTSYQTPGGHHRYDPDEIEALLRERRHPRTRPRPRDPQNPHDSEDPSLEVFW